MRTVDFCCSLFLDNEKINIVLANTEKNSVKFSKEIVKSQPTKKVHKFEKLQKILFMKIRV